MLARVKEATAMRSPRAYLSYFFLALWGSIALAALWRVHSRATEASLALTAGALLLASLGMSRYILGLTFTSAPMLYLALLGLFHLGTVLPWALGIYDASRISWFVPYGLSPALALISYSIITYQLGLLVALKGCRHHVSITVSNEPAGLEDSKVFIAGNFAVLAGATMFVIGLIRLDSGGYYRLIYSELWRLRAESDPRLFGTGITVALIGLCLMAAGSSRRQLQTTYFYTGIWFSILFYMGFRSPAVTAALLVYAVSHKKGIKRSRWFVAVAGLSLLVAIPVMTVIREQPLDERSLDSFRQVNVFDGPAELGESLWPLVETLNVTKSENYRYGATYLIAIKRILPNLALHWEAPAAETIDDLPPNLWITAIASPWSYKNYQGIGFSAVAEPYMNFGTIGVVFVFFLLGFLLVRMEQASIRNSYGLARWALILGPLLWASRNDSTQFFRPAIWGLLYLGSVALWSGKCSSMASITKRVNFWSKPKALRESQT
jgi:oligosaccharide repeat unit polymerase